MSTDDLYTFFACSYGRGTKGRIYERLRKRSYRRSVQFRKALDVYYGGGEFPAGDEWYEDQHDAYLAGVRDGLNAQELR